jgi:hypothetical protein
MFDLMEDDQWVSSGCPVRPMVRQKCKGHSVSDGSRRVVLTGGRAHNEFHVQRGDFPGPNSKERTGGEVFSRSFKRREEVEPMR